MLIGPQRYAPGWKRIGDNCAILLAAARGQMH